MAHHATLLVVPIEAVSKPHTRESLFSCIAKQFDCSHFIAAHPEIRPILNNGNPIISEMWHPIVKPHYRLPADLRPLSVTLEKIKENDLREDEWTSAEVKKLKDACDYAIQQGLALVVFLSGTLSHPPHRKW